MTCWACQHPKCSGDGCEARQPVARVGKYTCEKCLYPPCNICKTTPRPQGGGSKYKCHIMPEWVCPGCKTSCRKCGGVSKCTCEKCLYPPCHICKTTPRPCRTSMYKCHIMPEWVCHGCKTNCAKCGRACLEKKTEGRTREEGIGLCDACLLPPCPTCGKARPKDMRRYWASVLQLWT